MTMKKIQGVLFAVLSVTGTGLAAQETASADLVAQAVLAAPEAFRAEAEVRAFRSDGSLETIREGKNGLICLADRPGDASFQVTCYHRALEPFIARGRELAAQEITGMERQEQRWREVEAGTLAMPDGPAMVYNLSGASDAYDPATGKVTGGSRLHAVYIPYATPESTGLTAQPGGGVPWLMWPGKPSAHIMIALPGEPGG